MDFMGRIGAIVIVAIVAVFAILGLAVFGPFVLMIAIPLLLIAGCIWILRQYKGK